MSDALPAAIGLLIAAYPNQPFPEDTARVYARMLADVDEHRLVAAVESLLKIATYRPTIAEIRLTVARDALDLPSAAEIYDRIVNYDGIGRIDMPDFAREVMTSMGGPWAFHTSENPGILRAQWTREYSAAAERLTARTAQQHQIAAAFQISPTMAGLPYSDRLTPRPLWQWAADRGEPTDEQKREAIKALHDDDPILKIAALEMLDQEGQ